MQKQVMNAVIGVEEVCKTFIYNHNLLDTNEPS